MFLEHIQSLAAAPSEIQSEVVKYKEAFTLMADKAGKALVCFERNFRVQPFCGCNFIRDRLRVSYSSKSKKKCDKNTWKTNLF